MSTKFITSLFLLLMGQLPLAVAETEEPSVRQTQEQFQRWTVACIEEKITVCEARHAILAPNGGVQAQLSLSNRTDQPGQLLLQIALPLLADLKKEVVVKVGGQPLHPYHYSFCNQAACFIAEIADEEAITAFKKGIEFSVLSRSIQNGDQVMKGSLLGFSAALNRLKSKVAP
ncbi:MAG: hypothetical protein HOL17_13840 [Gammaproteobacteria bacterium]|nr:hypothetical protein [Gammaproteobacteria bacterium]MBT4299803.1 hypothetical protein [Gammaproteobacteria bacterium]MBT4549699.1 hypothetical protein [Gammaproteobacteria bacterium]MBT5372784.1 hypothetical protein [Gammaproteobacteria bacterium]